MKNFRLLTGLIFALFLLFACEKTHTENTTKTDSLKFPLSDSLREAPMLAELVAAGKLPPLEERLPENPQVVQPRDRLGNYCDRWRMATVGAGNLGGIFPRISYYSLIHWAQDWASLEPGIAERWEVSADARKFTFYLRKGIKFSDGHPFTADDVAFTIKYILFNRNLTKYSPLWLMQEGKPAKFKQLGKYSFQFSFDKPFLAFLLQLASESNNLLQPAHYLKKFIPPFISEAEADSLAEKNGFAKWHAYVGTIVKEPFRNPDLPCLSPWVRTTPRGKAETRWIFERNPYFYMLDSKGKQLPYFDKFILENVSNLEQVYLKIISGEVDCQNRHITGERTRFLLKNEERGGYKVLFYPVDAHFVIYLNRTHSGDSLQNVLNNDRYFRLALSLAIDRDEILKLLNMGQGLPLTTNVCPPGYENYEPILEWFRFDPARANRILDSLGLPRGADGWRQRPDNKPLALTIYQVEFDPIDFVELVREYWEKIGVKLIIKKISYQSWFDLISSGKYDAVASSYAIFNDATEVLHPEHYFPTYSTSTWGPHWGQWYSSHGNAGEKPPAEILEIISDWKEIQYEADPGKQLEKLYQLRVKSYEMGNVILVKPYLPGIEVVKKNFYNVSHEYWRANWAWRAPAPDYPETYFMK